MIRLLPLLFAVQLLLGQNTNNWDTLKYQKFRTNLIVGLFQSYRNFENEFSQTGVRDSLGISPHRLRAESNLVTGIEIAYDKFSLALGLRSVPPENSSAKGKTNMYSLNFNFGGNRWLLENSLRYFKGFYTTNMAYYDSSDRNNRHFYLRPNYTNTLVRSKFLYFTNHKKYSIRSNYACNYRQVRTGSTWIFSANTNYNYMNNDSSFFHPAARPYYGDRADLKGLKVIGLSTNAGGAFTLVLWRAFFAHVMFMFGPEQQWRQYDYPGKTVYISQLSVSYDLRGSIGLNFRRFYYIIYGTSDAVIYDSTFMKLTSRSINGGFTIGWRFRSGTPEVYKKFQNSRLYKTI